LFDKLAFQAVTLRVKTDTVCLPVIKDNGGKLWKSVSLALK